MATSIMQHNELLRARRRPTATIASTDIEGLTEETSKGNKTCDHNSPENDETLKLLGKG